AWETWSRGRGARECGLAPADGERVVTGETTRAPVDVFEKARTHDRKEQLEAAKEADLLPYFRLIESEAGPTVEMEGRETIMLGCRLSGAKLRPFRHNQMDKRDKMLERAAGDGGGVLVVVDGVFSMEGDICPLPELLERTERHGVRLMVDEAHAVGVLGDRGA